MVFTETAGRRHVGTPIRFSKEPARQSTSVPEFGEDSEEIAMQAGLSPAEISRLKQRGTL